MSDPFYELLGAEAAPSTGSDEPMITVRFTDLKGLVAKEGGGTGSLALMLAPGTITNKVYSDAKDAIASSLRERGIAAAVNVESARPMSSLPVRSDLITGMMLGVGGLGLGWAILKLFKGK